MTERRRLPPSHLTAKAKRRRPHLISAAHPVSDFMKTRPDIRRVFDPGFLIVLVIGLIAVWPFLSRASLPEGTDAELHIFRLHELSLLIRGGEFYPRWAPNFYHGYGYPIFNYYAPLIYYLALPLELLPQVDAVLASKIILIAGMLLAGVGLYGYVRDNWGRYAGFVAAALYMYAPYLQYIDPHVRGALPEAFSFGIFPLALWALDRHRRGRSPWSWMASIFLVAGVILSHNLMGFFFFGVLIAWAMWQLPLNLWSSHQIGASARQAFLNVAWLFAALLLGLGVAAFFWLPVILERDAVTLSTLIGAGDNYDFRTHFLSIAEMVSPSVSPDWGATQSPLRFNLGVAQWLAGLLGLLMLLLNRLRARWQVLFFAISAGFVLFMMLSASQPVWELVSFLPYFQFPWRLLGAAAMFLAILGAAGFDGLLRAIPALRIGLRPAWATAIAVLAPMVLALPLSQPAPWADFGDVNTLRMSLIENSGRWLGTTSTADYVPATVDMLPVRRGEVIGPIAEGRPPDRVNYEAMPEGASVVAEVIRPLKTRYHVIAPKQFRLRLYQFDFPGWHVRVDGTPAVTELAQPEGFIVVLVPEGEHVVEVVFGNTSARTLAWLITAAALIIATILGWSLARNKPQMPALQALDKPERRRSIDDWPVLAVIGGFSLAIILLEPLGLFHHATTNRALDIPATNHYANFGDQIALLGFADNAGDVAPGGVIDISLFWQALRPLEIDYQVFVHLLDENGVLQSQSDKLNPGEFPTRRWPLDRYVPDSHRLSLPPDLPPGVYTVAAGLWVQDEGWRLPVFAAGEQQIGDFEPLFTVVVK